MDHVTAFYHVINADPDPPIGVETTLCLRGPCPDTDHCNLDHVWLSGREYSRPVVYAEIRQKWRAGGLWNGWRVRVMRRNELGDSYGRTGWMSFWTRAAAEAWATAEIARINAPEAPPIIFIPEEDIHEQSEWR